MGAKLFGNMRKTILFAQKFIINHMTTLNITENIARSLEIECAKAGTNITEVCRIAGVQRSTVQRWKEEDPKTIQVVRRLMEIIEQKAKENGKEKGKS